MKISRLMKKLISSSPRSMSMIQQNPLLAHIKPEALEDKMLKKRLDKG